MFRAVLLIATLASGPACAERLVIFAAASLKGPLDAIAAEWSAQNGAEAVMSYGSSAALARQIAAGAPADVYLAASIEWAEWVAEASGREAVSFASNRLVLIAPVSEAAEGIALDAGAIDARLGAGGRMAIAATEAVPAGRYGRAALEHLGLWDGLEARLAETRDVRAALVLVARGQAPLGLVYASDAASSEAVRVLAVLPAEAHPEVHYSAVALGGPEAAGFVAALGDPTAQGHLADAGFLPPPVP